MERLRNLYVLTRRAFLGLLGGLITMLVIRPSWAGRKVKILAARITQTAAVFTPTILGGQTGTWPSYGEAY